MPWKFWDGENETPWSILRLANSCTLKWLAWESHMAGCSRLQSARWLASSCYGPGASVGESDDENVHNHRVPEIHCPDSKHSSGPAIRLCGQFFSIYVPQVYPIMAGWQAGPSGCWWLRSPQKGNTKTLMSPYYSTLSHDPLVINWYPTIFPSMSHLYISHFSMGETPK